MLTPEQVAEIRQDNERIWSEEADTRRPGSIRLLLNDRTGIAQELTAALSRKAEPGYSMTKALTALIERIK